MIDQGAAQASLSGIRPNLVIAGRYRLVRELSAGGMGTVWVARHLTLGCELALKFVRSAESAGGDALERFAAEARSAALLAGETDHVPRIHDFGVDGALPYIAMELLRGEDLGARLGRRGRLTLAELAPIATQIARALRKAHGRGIVHRDLKPENVFLVHRDDEERVKILDFGIAKILGSASSTIDTTPMGTIPYMAPEALRRARVDARADLWSFAVVLYRAVTGVLPFDGARLIDLVRRICDAPAPRPSRFIGGLGSEIDAFFERALARDPEDRYQHADELCRAFLEAARLSWRPPPSGVVPVDLEAAVPTPAGLASRSSDRLPTLRCPVASW